MVSIERVSARNPEVRRLVRRLDDYQSGLYPPESNHLDSIEELEKEHVCLLAAVEDGRIVGCGAVKVLETYAEIKRMFVAEESRGRGVARRLLERLEAYAREEGVAIARLETGVDQQPALQFYKASGYREREPFGDYKEDPLSVFMEKSLRES